MEDNQADAAKSQTFKIVMAFLAIYIIWGTTFLGIRIAVETLPPFMMAGLRFLSAGGIMLLFLLMRGRRFPGWLYWRSALIVGGLMLVGGIGLLSLAEKQLPSGLAALVVTTIPLWITLIEWLGFRGTRPGLQTFIGLGIGLAGAVLLFLPEIQGALTDSNLPGMSLVLVGAVLFATGSVYSKRAPMPADTGISTAIEMVAGGGLLLIVSAAAGEFGGFDPAAVTTRSLLALAYLSLIGSVIGYTAYLWLLKTVEPAKVGTNFYVNPVVALLLGWLLAGETITGPMIIAAAVILVGVAVINTHLPRAGVTQKPASGVGDQRN